MPTPEPLNSIAGLAKRSDIFLSRNQARNRLQVKQSRLFSGEVQKLAATVCLAVFLAGYSWPLLAREPKPKSQSKELAWEGNPAEEFVSTYNVYEKIEGGRKGPIWKKIGTAHEPKFRVQNLTPGSHIFAVTAVSIFGESPRGSELVVKIPNVSTPGKKAKE